jgi:two-component system, OmpR family, response regulator QseB
VRILLVEDDSRIAGPVATDLRRRQHVVDVAADGREGLAYAQTGAYDLLLLDIMLPGLDGLTICRRLRDEGQQAMIVMLTAGDTIEDKVCALDAGADDYLAKPFDLEELAARVRAVARRSRAALPRLFEHGNLRVDLQLARAAYADRAHNLTRTEFAILETLTRNSQQIFTREMLQEKVTSFESEAGPQTIKTHIANLRRKLRAAGCQRDPIENVYGLGYRLADL